MVRSPDLQGGRAYTSCLPRQTLPPSPHIPRRQEPDALLC
jgi:hypothetical protein